MTEQPRQDTAQVQAWLEAHLGGTVTSIWRQPRWRPVWFAELDNGGVTQSLVIRGDRTDMPLIFPLRHEMTLQAMLHERDIPTPAVHGWIDEPMAYVMDSVGGQQHFENTNYAYRESAVYDYQQIWFLLVKLD
jgi:aminoglycoside phosphotransferase (APT) family kinase protein